MMKLYFAPGACSFVPHALLEATGAAFEPLLVKLHKNEQRGAEYLALNPRGQVPVLVTEDNVVLTQIVALVTYLHERFPEQGFLPAEPLAKARAMSTLAWMNNTVHPTFTHVFMPHKYTSEAQAQEQIQAEARQQYAGLMRELQVLVQAADAANQPWLGGERFGPLDAYALTLTRWGGFAGVDPLSLPALWAHVQKVALHPPAARVVERERLQLNVYKSA